MGLNGASFSAVKGQVEQAYRNEGKWFSGIRAWFATVKHCMGFEQEKVRQALSNLGAPAVPQASLRSRGTTSGTTATEAAPPNSPEVRTKLLEIGSNFRSKMLAFRLEANVTKGTLQELSSNLDDMLVELYSSPLKDSANATTVYNKIYALKGEIDAFIRIHVGSADNQVLSGTESFKRYICSTADNIGVLSEWGT
jgi:hypothetical protein